MKVISERQGAVHIDKHPHTYFHKWMNRWTWCVHANPKQNQVDSSAINETDSFILCKCTSITWCPLPMTHLRQMNLVPAASSLRPLLWGVKTRLQYSMIDSCLVQLNCIYYCRGIHHPDSTLAQFWKQNFHVIWLQSDVNRAKIPKILDTRMM